MNIGISIKKDSTKVAKAIIVKDNKILLLKRSSKVEKHKGEWDLPGGHTHVGERLLNGLKREIFEETNLASSGEKLVYKDRIKDHHFFLVKETRGVLSLSSEHDSHAFVEFSRIPYLQNLTNYYRNVILKCLKLGGYEVE
jgi:8-oxo-dGTP pyrophosphatase MutT (NUDIX family)